jgi:protoporphyrinogen oxidase
VSAVIDPKRVETSLVESFLYPKLGPGQMWEEVARQVRARGGEILTRFEVDKILVEGNQVRSVVAKDSVGGHRCFAADYVLSTMPITDLIRALDADVPHDIRKISEGLMYRDFMIVGILLNKLCVGDSHLSERMIADNWIYLQEPGVRATRLQIFNNWSPYLVAKSSNIWIGVEYVCSEHDWFWRTTDDDMASFAISELQKIGLINSADVLDHTVVRAPRA